MKETWKKCWKYLLILPIIAVAVVVLVFTLPDGKMDALSVNAKDVVLKVGDSKLIDYEVNIKQAVVTFDVADETKANIDVDEKEIVGLSVGSTTLTVTAKYGNETSVVTVGVTVLKDNLPSSELEPSTPEEPTYAEDKIKVLVDNNEVNELLLSLGESAVVKIESEENITSVKSSSEVSLREIATGLYLVTAEKVGYYNLNIQTSSYQRTIDVIVN